ncbi:hypothetical protein Tco_1183950 [Tanacetum coccineum]
MESGSKQKKNKIRQKFGRFHFTPSKNQSNHWNEKLKKIGYPSMTEPPKLELKELPEHLEYAFLQGDDQLLVVITSALSALEKTKLLKDEFKPTVQPQRRVNPNIKEVVKKEVINLLDAGLIYPISDIPWVSPVQVVPKKGGINVAKNEKNELIPQRTVIEWRVCIDYRKLNDATQKDHFPLPFID